MKVKVLNLYHGMDEERHLSSLTVSSDQSFDTPEEMRDAFEEELRKVYKDLLFHSFRCHCCNTTHTTGRYKSITDVFLYLTQATLDDYLSELDDPEAFENDGWHIGYIPDSFKEYEMYNIESFDDYLDGARWAASGMATGGVQVKRI